MGFAGPVDIIYVPKESNNFCAISISLKYSVTTLADGRL